LIISTKIAKALGLTLLGRADEGGDRMGISQRKTIGPLKPASSQSETPNHVATTAAFGESGHGGPFFMIAWAR
jgi:hypothetical protein